MSDDNHSTGLDMVRWTFEANLATKKAIEDYLVDLGAEVLIRDESQFVVTWDEPEGDLDDVVDEIWALNGAPCEVTYEEFRRMNLMIYQPDEDGEAQQSSSAA